eukprot:PRCOL_00006009-RA
MAADDAIFVRVAEDMSSLQWHADRVSSAQAGAVATFSGVTRDSFEAKTVVRLEYEAYVPMAEAKLRQIAEECVKRGALKCAISHKPLVLVRPLLTRLTRDARATSRRPRGGAPHPVDAVGCAAKLGVVPVSEASVIIALSSAHRKEGIEALHWAIDELKARVPIWKKECYEDGSVWKENAEQRRDERE